jgi:monomeric isocitrate dehydrogenase
LQDVFAKHAALFRELNVNANNGLGDVYEKIKVGVYQSSGSGSDPDSNRSVDPDPDPGGQK